MTEREWIQNRIKELTGWASVGRFSIITDTSDWTRIERGDIVQLGGRRFLIKGHQHETRFGIKDQPKYWVFNAVDIDNGELKIIKTVFNEEFYVHVGVFRIHCYRSPEKEGYVLNIVRGDDRFMQGYTMMDDKENRVRVIDFIKGMDLFSYIHGIEKSHEQYYYEDLPNILHNLLDSIEAIDFLHKRGTFHGDIRNDHIIIDSETGKYRWIDFDLNQHVSDYDIWSLGNILNYVVAKGIMSFQTVLKDERIDRKIRDSLGEADASAFFQYRIMNLKKLFPYLNDKLSDLLMHYTVKPRKFYSNCGELIADFKEMLKTEFKE